MKYFNIRRRSGGSARRPRWGKFKLHNIKKPKARDTVSEFTPMYSHPFRPFQNHNRDQRWRRYTLGLHIWRSRN